MASGKFITLEGGEGSGKSTQAGLLAKALEDLGLSVVQTREPGGAPGAEDIRRLLVEGSTERWQPLSETLLHLAARHEHVEATLKPALSGGRWVVCDRFADSTVAYQGYGHGIDMNVISDLQARVLGGFKPDLTVILDVPVDVGLARAGGRNGNEDRYERMDVDFHQRIRDGFLSVAKDDPDRCGVVDATQPADQVHEWIVTLVRRRLGEALP